MKQPLQALLIAGKAAQAKCDLGQKQITIRNGTRAFRVDESMVLCCHVTNWCTMVKVTNVRHCTLIAVTDQEFADDGFAGIHAALADLQKFYPDLTYDSPVTIVRWKLSV